MAGKCYLATSRSGTVLFEPDAILDFGATPIPDYEHSCFDATELIMREYKNNLETAANDYTWDKAASSITINEQFGSSNTVMIFLRFYGHSVLG